MGGPGSPSAPEAGEVTASLLDLGARPWRPCELWRYAQAHRQSGERSSPDPGDSPHRRARLSPAPSSQAVPRPTSVPEREVLSGDDSVRGDLPVPALQVADPGSAGLVVDEVVAGRAVPAGLEKGATCGVPGIWPSSSLNRCGPPSSASTTSSVHRSPTLGSASARGDEPSPGSAMSGSQIRDVDSRAVLSSNLQVTSYWRHGSDDSP